MTDQKIAISLLELRTRAGVTARTIRAWLRRKDIKPIGKSVLMSDIKRCWPGLYDAIRIGEHRAPCPDCGSPTCITCTVCDFSSSAT